MLFLKFSVNSKAPQITYFLFNNKSICRGILKKEKKSENDRFIIGVKISKWEKIREI